MNRWLRRLLILAGVGVAVAVVLSLAGVLIVRTDWFHDQVRQRIVAELERATGGEVEISSFRFNWPTLEARIDGLVIRGDEPADNPPLLRAELVVVGLRVISAFRGDVNIALLAVRRPEVYIVVDAEGNSNVPGPAARIDGDGDPLGPLLDLAIQRFEITEGVLVTDSEAYPFSAKGDHLVADAVYQPAARRYEGHLRVEQFEIGGWADAPMAVNAEVAWFAEEDRIGLSPARLWTRESSATVTGTVEGFPTPVWTGEVSADLALSEMAAPLNLPLPPEGRIGFEGNSRIGSGSRQANGQVTATDLAWRQGRFAASGISGVAELALNEDQVELADLSVTVLGGRFNGSASAVLGGEYHLDGGLRGFRLQNLAQSTGLSGFVWSGTMSGPLTVSGDMASDTDFRLAGEIDIAPGGGQYPLDGELSVRSGREVETVVFSPSWLETASTRADFSGPLGGVLDVRVETEDLEDLKPVLDLFGRESLEIPVRLNQGGASFEGQVAEILDGPSSRGKLTAGPLIWDRHEVERVSANVELDSARLVASNFSIRQREALARGDAEVALDDWKLTDASSIEAEFTITGASIATMLHEAGRDWPADGTLSGAARVSGTLGAPEVLAPVHVDRLSIRDEVFETADAEIRYSPGRLVLDSGRARAAHGSVSFQATYEHPRDNWNSGELRIATTGEGLSLAQWQFVEEYREELDAAVRWNLSATVEIDGGFPRLSLLSGEVMLGGLEYEERQLGEVRLTASNRSNIVVVRGVADIRGSQIEAMAEWSLVGDSFGLGQVRFTDLTLEVLRDFDLFGGPTAETYVTSVMDGEIGFSGPILQPGSWRGMARLSRLEIGPSDTNESAAGGQLLRNADPVLLAIDNRVITVQSAHLVSEDSNLNVTGTLSFLRRNPWNLNLDGDLDLAALRAVKHDLLAEGRSTIDATVRGSLLEPQVNGRLEFENASFHLEELPNGLNQVTGAIVFDRSRATFERFTSRTGGGNLSLAGFILFGGEELVYRLHADAQDVRVRYPEGVSTVLDASLDFTGTSTRSLLSGEVAIARAALDPDIDIASLLSRASRPVIFSDVANPFLLGMGLDIRLVTAGGAEVMTSLTRDIELEADLNVRGGPARPVLLGRVSVNQGEILFFGNRYTITQGEIRFLNPATIEPVVAIDLETRVRGYTVTISFTGTLDRPNFSYRSDPPLQSHEIIALLAVGRAPSAVRSGLATRSSTVTGQGVVGSNPNEVLGQALAAPISGRLQRFFGVSRIKIDPQLTGLENTPETRITVEQQLSREITLTYVTNLSRTQQQVVRIEWNFHKDWSVHAVRESNGVFGVDFVLRRQL